MKTYIKIALIALCFKGINASAQVGMTGNSPSKSAALDLNASNKGLLVPRVSLNSTTDVSSVLPDGGTGKPAQSVMVFNTNVGITGTNAAGIGYYYWDTNIWKKMATTDSDWRLGGNNNGAVKTIGTNDAFDLPFVTTGNEKMRLTTAGNVGINTTTPGNKLEVNNGAGSDTGLKLPTGAAAGKVLASDVDGNAVWQSSALQFQTSIAGVGGYKAIAVPGLSLPAQIRNFSTTALFDDVRTIYGASYGWDGSTQNYVVPRNGKYRVTLTLYFQSGGKPDQGWRAYVDVNNSGTGNGSSSAPSMPFISITTSGLDQIGNCSGIMLLKQGDILNVKVTNWSNTDPIGVYLSSNHSILTIESL